MLCEFKTEQTANGFRQYCPKCGHAATTSTERYLRNCEIEGPPKPGLGDLSAYALAHLGITKEKFAEWMGKDGDCSSCAKRQEKLNRFGRYLAKRAEKLGITLPF